LISLGGWIRATEIVTDIIYKNYSEATASLIRQPALAAYLRGKIKDLSPKVRDDAMVASLNKQLEEVQKLVTFPADTTASKEDVKKLRDAVASMVKEIATKTN
jgi:hypothetical protein